MVFPDIVALTVVRGSVTVSAVPAGGGKKQTVTLPGNVLIIGVPKVSTSTADADAEIVNGGRSEFTVRAINNGSADQDVVVEYEVYVVRES